MKSVVILAISVVIFLVATSSHASGMCSVPIIGGDLGDCSARSAAEMYFSDSIDISMCQLFFDQNFNSTNYTNSWPNVTDDCIGQSSVIEMFLYHTTPSGPGRPPTAAMCQTYEQNMQCRMDCLIIFDLLVPNTVRFGYIHLRAISCNETLFTTSISTIFNNQNDIQPTFTSRQLVNTSPTIPISSSTSTLSSSLSFSPTLTTAVAVTSQPAQSLSSATSSITPSSSPSPSSTQSQTTPTSTPATNTQCTVEADALCQSNQDCGNSQFSMALTTACDSTVLIVHNSTMESVRGCTAAHQLFDTDCNTMLPKLRNVTCDCGDRCLSGLSPSSSECSASCILWFENTIGSSSIFVIIRNIISGKEGFQFLTELVDKTCRDGYSIPSDILMPSCCPSREASKNTQIIAAAAIGAGVLLGLFLILVCVCCCCCVKYKNRRAKAIITGDRRTATHVAAANPSFGPTSPCSTMELGVMPPSPNQPMHPNQGVAMVIDKWKKIIRRVLSLQDIHVIGPIGEGAFGQVHQGQLVRRGLEPQQVAVKTLKNAFSPEEVDDFISESAIMLDFDHPNVLQLLGVCFDTPDHLPLIVLPYMANGDLRSFLRNKRQQSTNSSVMPEGISINILLDMCLDIATGMEYLANNKFVHRDLAARNCMVNEALEVKVADFGLSRDMYTKNYYRMESRKKLPIKWMAPECLNDTMYDEMTDVWSFGVTCWEIFTLGHTPYATVDNSDILDFIVERGRRLTKPAFSPKEIWLLMQRCWLLEPANRPKFTSLKESIQQICHHYRYQTVTHSASPITHSVSPGCYAQPYLFPDQLQDSSEGESSDNSSSPSTAKVAAMPVAISEGANRRLSSVSTISGEYNHLGHPDSSGSSGVHFMSSVEASATDTSFNIGDSKISQGITVTPERNEYTNVVIRDPNTEPSYDDRGQSLADTGRHSITMPPAPHHYFMLDPDAIRAQRTYHTGTL